MIKISRDDDPNLKFSEIYFGNLILGNNLFDNYPNNFIREYKKNSSIKVLNIKYDMNLSLDKNLVSTCAIYHPLIILDLLDKNINFIKNKKFIDSIIENNLHILIKHFNENKKFSEIKKSFKNYYNINYFSDIFL